MKSEERSRLALIQSQRVFDNAKKIRRKVHFLAYCRVFIVKKEKEQKVIFVRLLLRENCIVLRREC